jgi:hypothetical protein
VSAVAKSFLATQAKHLRSFVASKAPWFEITDNLPQYPEYPPV